MEGAGHAYVERLKQDFADLKDPRVVGRCDHLLLDIVAIALLASICGCEDWAAIATFAKEREAWLKTFLALPKGIPTRHTYRRVFNKLDRKVFATCLFRWTQAIQKAIGGEVVSFDGKSLRGSSAKSRGFGMLHLVTAWASENRLTLGQVACEEKSNEITAIPELLEVVDVEGCTVTIDAMGCQREIAAKIREKKADYVLAVKDNQPTLAKEMCDLYLEVMDGQVEARQSECESEEKGHGRIEKRTCKAIEIPKEHRQRGIWEGLRTLVVVTLLAIREGKEQCETRWFISSLPPQATKLAQAVRQHWSIENSQHYILDVTFGEDSQRQQDRNGAANLAAVRRMALSLLRRSKPEGQSVKNTRLRCALNPEYLLELLQNAQI